MWWVGKACLLISDIIPGGRIVVLEAMHPSSIEDIEHVDTILAAVSKTLDSCKGTEKYVRATFDRCSPDIGDRNLHPESASSRQSVSSKVRQLSDRFHRLSARRYPLVT